MQTQFVGFQAWDEINKLEKRPLDHRIPRQAPVSQTPYSIAIEILIYL